MMIADYASTALHMYRAHRVGDGSTRLMAGTRVAPMSGIT